MKSTWKICLVLLALPALSKCLWAQHADEGPILMPHNQTTPKPGEATMLVVCDRACDWKLDGAAQGHIEAGAVAKTKVEIGQHIVEAATAGDRLKARKIVQIKGAQRAVVSLELTEGGIAPAPHPPAPKSIAEVWVDPANGLMWTARDSGQENDLAWQQAVDYCHTLNLAGHADWRLPTIDELAAIFDASASAPLQCCGGVRGNAHVKGKLQLSGNLWSNTPGYSANEAWSFDFAAGTRFSYRLGGRYLERALCVRRGND